ncbi:MAG TPA: hypothetical protein VGY54_07730 [Polyangiaceae bacterium]|jgi:hypothetical protein|nr:hypothetical protein [Polyangiaceae bacterium]
MQGPPPEPRLAGALDEAVLGRPAPLYAWLVRGSRLPSARANDALADGFAQLCRERGKGADTVALALARLTPDEAPGASAREFLPVCGIAALGARGAADPEVRTAFVRELHAHADDLRFRVRDAVILALGRVGAAAGDTLVAEAASWMDGYFHAAAVITALGREPWLPALRDARGAIARLDDAFALARDAPRAAARYPGRKALVEALECAPGLLAMRLGVPVFDMLVGWAGVSDPELRGLIEETVRDKRLVSRFGADVARVHAALEASRPPVRNPDHDVGPTRDRSGGRRRRGR